VVEVKARFYLITLAIILVGLLVFVSSDTVISIADTSVPDNEVASSVGKASNSSASAGIVFTMTEAVDE
jgi:hypothetical protein